MRFPTALIALTALVPALCAPASAALLTQTDAALAERNRYMACLDLVAQRPDDAIEDAQTWRMQGGGWPARQCEAEALIALGEEAYGAGMLDDLAMVQRAGNETATRIDQLSKAGQAWLSAGLPAEARESLAFAISLAPDNIDLLAEHASAVLAEEDWPALADAANALIQRAPDRVEGWKHRARSAYERQDYAAARADIREARERAPEDIEILVLRGQVIEAERQAGE